MPAPPPRGTPATLLSNTERTPETLLSNTERTLAAPGATHAARCLQVCPLPIPRRPPPTVPPAPLACTPHLLVHAAAALSHRANSHTAALYGARLCVRWSRSSMLSTSSRLGSLHMQVSHHIGGRGTWALVATSRQREVRRRIAGTPHALSSAVGPRRDPNNSCRAHHCSAPAPPQWHRPLWA